MFISSDSIWHLPAKVRVTGFDTSLLRRPHDGQRSCNKWVTSSYESFTPKTGSSLGGHDNDKSGRINCKAADARYLKSNAINFSYNGAPGET